MFLVYKFRKKVYNLVKLTKSIVREYTLNQRNQSTTNKTWALLYKIGIILIVSSFLFWIVPVVVPFTPLSIGMKTSLITGAIIIAEVLFWTGALLAGKEVATKIRGYFNPKNWKKQKKKEHGDDE